MQNRFLRAAGLAVLCLGTVALATSPNVKFNGTFPVNGTQTFLENWETVQCGGDAGFCPCGWTPQTGTFTGAPGVCVTDAVSPTTPRAAAPLETHGTGDGCPNGLFNGADHSPCRFQPQAGTVRFLTMPTDMMDNGLRNEVQQTKEGGALMYPDGTERWYLWYTTFMSDQFPNPPADDGGGNNAFNTILQFHQFGECGTGGIPIGIGVQRTDTVNGTNRGNEYKYAMGGEYTYLDDGGTSNVWHWPANGAGTTAITKDTRHKFILHVIWSKSATTGYVGLQIDGTNVYQNHQSTMQVWPSPALCAADQKYYGVGNMAGADGGVAMQVFMKQGLYRDPKLSFTFTTQGAAVDQEGVIAYDGCPPNNIAGQCP